MQKIKAMHPIYMHFQTNPCRKGFNTIQQQLMTKACRKLEFREFPQLDK
jgi:hypothetical protein